MGAMLLDPELVAEIRRVEEATGRRDLFAGFVTRLEGNIGRFATAGAVSAGFPVSTRLPSATFAASPVARTSVVSTPESTSTSFPKSRPIWTGR